LVRQLCSLKSLHHPQSKECLPIFVWVFDRPDHQCQVEWISLTVIHSLRRS
jgi:hypothetical protein